MFQAVNIASSAPRSMAIECTVDAVGDDQFDPIELVDHIEKEGPVAFVPGTIPHIDWLCGRAAVFVVDDQSTLSTRQDI